MKSVGRVDLGVGRENRVFLLGPLESLFALQVLLQLLLLLVEIAEIIDDNRNRQRNHQHTCNSQIFIHFRNKYHLLLTNVFSRNESQFRETERYVKLSATV